MTAWSLPGSDRTKLNPDRGMVLIAVLWIVAALSIIVTGITASVREESRMVTLGRQQVEGGAMGDAAIELALQAMAASTTRVSQLTPFSAVYRGVPVEVQIMPLNGLIDINNAPAPLVANLFAIAGGVPQDAAQALAQATVEMRSRRDSRGVAQRFEAVEDLLRVPGVDYPLYARLSRLITAELRSGGRVNALAAPAEVLAVVADGNTAAAAQIAQARQAGAVGIDTTALNPNFIGGAAVQQFRIQAWVPLPDGAWLRVAHDVDMNARGRDGLPWRTFQAFRSFEPMPSQTP